MPNTTAQAVALHSLIIEAADRVFAAELAPAAAARAVVRALSEHDVACERGVAAWLARQVREVCIQVERGHDRAAVLALRIVQRLVDRADQVVLALDVCDAELIPGAQRVDLGELARARGCSVGMVVLDLLAHASPDVVAADEAAVREALDELERTVRFRGTYYTITRRRLERLLLSSQAPSA